MWLFGLQRKSRPHRKRSHARYNVEWLATQLGKIVDLSESGVRIHGTGKTKLVAGKVVPVRLITPQGELNFTSRVAWVRRQKGGFEAGLALLDVKPHVAARLRQLAELGFIPDSAQAHDAPESPGPPRGKAAADANDPYAVLGIDPAATDEEIQRAYRNLARKLHPDVNKSADAAEQFDKVSRAHRALQRRRIRISAA